MSSYGARIVERRSAAPDDSAAGIKRVVKEGEANVMEIWPTE